MATSKKKKLSKKSKKIITMTEAEYAHNIDFWKQRGIQKGRDQFARELRALLNIEVEIDNAIDNHTDQYKHDHTDYY